ncbi:MAG: hypothetical protein KKB03_04265 [Nanoarchaeota archaeon]|nr:hypothetical protein [Nanoarchaeota archaeon]MBU1135774.1 hypothetical protein [Nanoarchaeota archaeon]MBU2520428.1 hypothetical protein [Nanoarchaeota archaeon]
MFGILCSILSSVFNYTYNTFNQDDHKTYSHDDYEAPSYSDYNRAYSGSPPDEPGRTHVEKGHSIKTEFDIFDPFNTRPVTERAERHTPGFFGGSLTGKDCITIDGRSHEVKETRSDGSLKVNDGGMFSSDKIVESDGTVRDKSWWE